MTQTEETFELKEELERVKLLLQKCNGDIVRADRELKSQRNKVLDEAIGKIEYRVTSGDWPMHWTTIKEILESLKL